ncbi:MAG TPA: hypothetical protein DDY78_15740 [Planctomycetales bacterium]|nr:hypothetical protein [Planctomycetales bacterium]
MFRILMPLTLLVACPLAGDVARAGFDTPVSLISRPSADSFGDVVAPQAAFDAMTSAVSAAQMDSEIDLPRQEAKDFLQLLTSSPPANLNLGAASTGVGGQSPPSNAGAAGTSNLPAMASRPQTDAPVLVGVLFLDAVLRRPPPFSSRLFRPPRCLWA